MLYCDLTEIFYCIQLLFELYHLSIKKYICTNEYIHIYIKVYIYIS